MYSFNMFQVSVFCVATATCLVQCISGQSVGCISNAPNNGGPLSCSSSTTLLPSGLNLASDLNLTGDLDLSGGLPFLSAVAFEGQYPTSGSASVSYGCGDCVAITQELGNPSGNNANVNSRPVIAGCNRRS